MNLKKIPYRASHLMMKGTLNLIKLPIPPVLTGADTVLRFPEIIALSGVSRPLIVTDKHLIDLKLLQPFLTALQKSDMTYFLYTDIDLNPDFENVYDGLEAYHTNECDSVIAFGGGRILDCGKIIAAKVTNDMPIPKMRGLFKLTHKIPPFFTIPTTAGTGSESTISATITDPEAHRKMSIYDPKLVPLATVLDSKLMVSLPVSETVKGGFDTLTRATESYIGRFDSALVKEKSISAIDTIMENLEVAVHDGDNLTLRANLAKASFDAGIAQTRAYPGYTQAIARILSAWYGISENVVCAAALPAVLHALRASCEKKLSELALLVGLGEPWEDYGILSERYINHIEALQERLGVPTVIEKLQSDDIPSLSKRILKEANHLYPVPKILSEKECNVILVKLCTQR